MEFSSKLLEKAVNEMAQLPGIGKRTALRLVLHLLKQPKDKTRFLSDALTMMREEVKFCNSCHNISDVELCEICSNTKRNHKIICVVEDIRDVMAIENTQQFNGVYHVLGGIISPLDGVGPKDLQIESLVNRIHKEEIEELIFALNPNIQGDTTIYYIQKKLVGISCKVTTIARGIAFGGELEFADEMTLAKSLTNRLPVQQYVK